MLYIITDLKNKNWLVYIIEEFRRINKANFPIKVIDSNGENNINEENAIHYTKEPSNKITIVNKSDVLPDKDIIKISKNLFVITGTVTGDQRFICKYDLFWNAFIFLSRLEEHLSENNGRRVQGYSFNHLRFDKLTFDKPIVNNLFDELERMIKNSFPNLTFGEKEKPVIELSHDVDYIEKTIQLRLKQTAFNLCNALRSIHNPAQFLKNCFKTVKFLFSCSSYWCFDYWENLEKKANKRSVFYVYAKSEKKVFKSWFIDPSYDLRRNKKLQQKLKDLIAGGFEVGLHGSSSSALDEESLAKEKEILEGCLGCEIKKVRQHWLEYEENTTPYIHSKLFQYDSSLGWNDIAGFRSGCASRHRPYDHKNQKAFSFFETPLIIIDSSIFDYHANNIDKAIDRAMRLLIELDNYKSSHVSISWHQRVNSSDYQWSEVYERLVNAI